MNRTWTFNVEKAKYVKFGQCLQLASLSHMLTTDWTCPLSIIHRHYLTFSNSPEQGYRINRYEQVGGSCLNNIVRSTHLFKHDTNAVRGCWIVAIWKVERCSTYYFFINSQCKKKQWTITSLNLYLTMKIYH